MDLYKEIPKKTIKTVSELPTKLRKSFEYKKQQSAVEWYRDIRHRQYYKSHLEFMFSNFLKNIHKDAFNRLIDGYFDLKNPMSVYHYYLPQWNEPVEDLTVHETAYLTCGLIRDGKQCVVDDLNVLLNKWHEEKKNTEKLFVSRDFSDASASYRKYLDESDIVFDAPIEPLTLALGNPLLSHGRPLNGYPITVDTRIDDETLVKSFRAWLKKRRDVDEEKARRPFNQNDFDDWAHYKIREYFDLEVWAAMTNVKVLDRVIAEYLWPNSSDSFSPLDVLRTTTRKKTEEIFSYPTCLRLFSQLRMELGENFLD